MNRSHQGHRLVLVLQIGTHAAEVPRQMIHRNSEHTPHALLCVCRSAFVTQPPRRCPLIKQRSRWCNDSK